VSIPPVQTMEQRLLALEIKLSSMREYIDDVNAIRREQKKKLKRIAAFAAMLVSTTALAGAFVSMSGSCLQQYMQYESSVSLPALDSMATWARTDVPGEPVGYTSEVLSLISDASQPNSFAWPLYIELRGTTDPGATITTSQSVGATVRALVRSSGTPWTAGFHSEMAHGRDALTSGTVVPTAGTSILFDGEMRSYSSGGETIGLNLHCVFTDSTSTNCDNGINIQTDTAATFWQNGIHFDSNGNYMNGNIGINFDQSRYNMGLDLANNSMRVNAGQKIILEHFGSVYIWYNPTSSKVEIVRSGVVVGSF
jgi:uncharacterized coiled-coil protein SlyX